MLNSIIQSRLMSTISSAGEINELIFLGHAGFILKNHETALLMDPWIYGKAFMGSWQINPYLEPEYRFKRVLDIISHCQDLYIWISHEHSDHFDKWFVKKLIDQYEKEINFLIPAFPGNSLKKRLAGIGVTNVVSMLDLD